MAHLERWNAYVSKNKSRGKEIQWSAIHRAVRIRLTIYNSTPLMMFKTCVTLWLRTKGTLSPASWLKKKLGREYRIAWAYESNFSRWEAIPTVRDKDGVVWSTTSTSCKGSLIYRPGRAAWSLIQCLEKSLRAQIVEIRSDKSAQTSFLEHLSNWWLWCWHRRG